MNRRAVEYPTRCPNCGKELTSYDYDVDHDMETGDPYLHVKCSECGHEE